MITIYTDDNVYVGNNRIFPEVCPYRVSVEWLRYFPMSGILPDNAFTTDRGRQNTRGKGGSRRNSRTMTQAKGEAYAFQAENMHDFMQDYNRIFWQDSYSEYTTSITVDMTASTGNLHYVN